MDTETEKLWQALDSVGGADDIYYDAATGRILLHRVNWHGGRV